MLIIFKDKKEVDDLINAIENKNCKEIIDKILSSIKVLDADNILFSEEKCKN